LTDQAAVHGNSLSRPGPLAAEEPRWRQGPWLFLILLAVAVLVRAQTFGNPVIEFDEQFYRLVGERMLDGAVPYVDIWDRKPIGNFLIYAFAALVGGKGPIAYQLLATLFATGTAFVLYGMARHVAGWRGALAAAIFYLLWLNLLQGEGGQSSVFYTLPVCLAARLVLRHLAGPGRGTRVWLRDGAVAMALLGAAIQIKYTVALEGALFGLAMLWTGRRAGLDMRTLAGVALLWIGIALAPTLAVWGAYAAMGHGDTWLFANVTSILKRDKLPTGPTIEDFLTGIGIILLPLLVALHAIRTAREREPALWFFGLWAATALLAILLLMTFSPHYWIPVMAPILLVAAPVLGRAKVVTAGMGLLALVAGQILIGFFIVSKGDARTVRNLVAAIGPTPNCLYVWDGFPALYNAADSCLPSRFVFPGHLNYAPEAHALGVEATEELRRILANRPDAVVTDEPAYEFVNRETLAILNDALASHYVHVHAEKTGAARWRHVYRIRPEYARQAGLEASVPEMAGTRMVAR